eukprot:scaffold762_cov156-Skeletonema_dohrnii-CCMP3373.AAC.1
MIGHDDMTAAAELLKRVSRQAREMEDLSMLLIKMETVLTAVEVNVSISFSFVKIRILTWILGFKFGF